jgi:AcrR family transcriptional regulator
VPAATKRADKSRPKRPRQALSEDRILRAAMRLVDRSGVDALSMRKLARALGVEAMSLYKHIADKDAVLDGLVDLVVREIGMPLAATDWRTAMRHHAISTRQACLRHRWAAVLMESRGAQTPIRLRYADAILELLRKAGFTVPVAYRTFVLIDSYLYGFIMQEANWPYDEGEMAQLATFVTSQSPHADYPSLVEAMSYIMVANPRRSGLYDAEFEHGLDMILDGLERVRRDAVGGETAAEAT